MSTTFFYLNSFLSFSSHRLAAGFLGLIALQFYILSSIFFVVSPPCNSLYLVPLLFSPPCNSIFCLLNSIFFVVSLLCVVEGFLGLTALQQPPAACLRQPSGHAPFAAHILAGIIITIIIIIITIIIVIVIITKKKPYDGKNSDSYFSCVHHVAYKCHIFLSISMNIILKCDSLYLSRCIVGHVVSIPSCYFGTLRQSDYIQTN